MAAYNEYSDMKKVYMRRRIVVGVIAAAMVGMLFSIPTREFLKITVLIGAPAMVAWGYWRNYRPYTAPWILLLILLLGLLAGYGYMMTRLPERIVVKTIQQQGDVLLTQGKYDQAIDRYRQLGSHGEKDVMDRKIRLVQLQKQFELNYAHAVRLYDSGQQKAAVRELRKIPRTAVVYSKAQKTLTQWERSSGQLQ